MNINFSNLNQKKKTKSFFGGRTRIKFDASVKLQRKTTTKKNFLIKTIKKERERTNSLCIWDKTKRVTFNPKEVLFNIKKRRQLSLMQKKKKFKTLLKKKHFKRLRCCFSIKDEKKIDKALKIVNERRLINENNKNEEKDTILQRIEKTKEIYLINLTTNIVGKEIKRLDEIDNLKKRKITM